jgi:transcriptional regulator with PAS, ATPase and Fis domain
VSLSDQEGLLGVPNLKRALDGLEKKMLEDALKQHPTELSAARSLGIHTTTLWRKASKHGLK